MNDIALYYKSWVFAVWLVLCQIILFLGRKRKSSYIRKLNIKYMKKTLSLCNYFLLRRNVCPSWLQSSQDYWYLEKFSNNQDLPRMLTNSKWAQQLKLFMSFHQISTNPIKASYSNWLNPHFADINYTKNETAKFCDPNQIKSNRKKNFLLAKEQKLNFQIALNQRSDSKTNKTNFPMKKWKFYSPHIIPWDFKIFDVNISTTVCN